ncbi:hypothetical protein Tco_0015607 [Tanacetum coccineum]
MGYQKSPTLSTNNFKKNIGARSYRVKKILLLEVLEVPEDMEVQRVLVQRAKVGPKIPLTCVVSTVKGTGGGKPCMRRDLFIIWAIKTSEELPLLHSLDLNSLFPETKMNLEILTHVM